MIMCAHLYVQADAYEQPEKAVTQIDQIVSKYVIFSTSTVLTFPGNKLLKDQ